MSSSPSFSLTSLISLPLQEISTSSGSLTSLSLEDRNELVSLKRLSLNGIVSCMIESGWILRYNQVFLLLLF